MGRTTGDSAWTISPGCSRLVSSSHIPQDHLLHPSDQKYYWCKKERDPSVISIIILWISWLMCKMLLDQCFSQVQAYWIRMVLVKSQFIEHKGRDGNVSGYLRLLQYCYHNSTKYYFVMEIKTISLKQKIDATHDGLCKVWKNCLGSWELKNKLKCSNPKE